MSRFYRGENRKRKRYRIPVNPHSQTRNNEIMAIPLVSFLYHCWILESKTNTTSTGKNRRKYSSVLEVMTWISCDRSRRMVTLYPTPYPWVRYCSRTIQQNTRKICEYYFSRIRKCRQIFRYKEMRNCMTDTRSNVWVTSIEYKA